MVIIFVDTKLEKLCHDEHKLKQKYGPINAIKIIQRIDQIRAIGSLGYMIQFRIGRCHPLKGDLKGCFALDIEHPKRLIIEPIFPEEVDLSKVDYSKVTKVKIIGVEDYHG